MKDVKERIKKEKQRIWKKNRIQEVRGSLGGREEAEGGREEAEGGASEPTGLPAGGGADPAPPRNLPKAPWKFQARLLRAPRSPCCTPRLLPRTLPRASAQPSPATAPPGPG